MKILIEPGGIRSMNVGDQGMLEVCYARLRGIWPDAEIGVLTLAPERVKDTLPGAIPVSPVSRERCLDRTIFGRLGRVLPGPLGSSVRGIESLALRRAPAFAAKVAAWKMRLRKQDAAVELLTMLSSIDLYVFSGAGMISDAFADIATEALLTQDLARSLGARTAVMGHMIGPIADERLLGICKRVLSRADLITVRERATSLPTLRACGVPESRILVTGDETLETIYAHRPVGAAMGSSLGINVRSAPYSGVEAKDLKPLGAMLKRFAQDRGALIEPLPIAHESWQNDEHALRLLLSDEGGSATDTEPEAVVGLGRRIAKCRLVVTGSYHAAVFALAQGVPAIGLAFSPYYGAKFRGLHDLFGEGCEFVDGSRSWWMAELEDKAAQLWTEAEALRPGLLASTLGQIAAGRSAYRRLRAIVEEPRVAEIGEAAIPPERVARRAATL